MVRGVIMDRFLLMRDTFALIELPKPDNILAYYMSFSYLTKDET